MSPQAALDACRSTRGASSLIQQVQSVPQKDAFVRTTVFAVDCGDTHRFDCWHPHARPDQCCLNKLADRRASGSTAVAESSTHECERARRCLPVPAHWIL